MVVECQRWSISNFDQNKDEIGEPGHASSTFKPKRTDTYLISRSEDVLMPFLSML